jgi:hypothetical protein
MIKNNRRASTTKGKSFEKIIFVKVKCIFHLSDDFLIYCAERTMALMTTLFKRLSIPLAKHKVVGPSTVIEYLVIILDTETRMIDPELSLAWQN